MSRRNTILYLARKRRVNRSARSDYAGLFAAPFDLGSIAAGDFLPETLTLPGRLPYGLGVSHSVGSVLSLEVNSEVVPTSIPAGGADEILLVEFGSGKGARLRISGVAVGDVTLYHRDQLGRYTPFANGTLT